MMLIEVEAEVKKHTLKPVFNELVLNIQYTVKFPLSRAPIDRVMVLNCPWKPLRHSAKYCMSNLTKIKWIMIINSCNASSHILHVPCKCCQEDCSPKCARMSISSPTDMLHDHILLILILEPPGFALYLKLTMQTNKNAKSIHVSVN